MKTYNRTLVIRHEGNDYAHHYEITVPEGIADLKRMIDDCDFDVMAAVLHVIEQQGRDRAKQDAMAAIKHPTAKLLVR